MSANALPSSTIERIAARLEGDIRQRGLRPGDRYLTAAEASKVFDVGSMTVHRAMQILAEREVLVRQRSRGTFVGPSFRPNSQASHDLDVLHLMMAMDSHQTQNHSSDMLVDVFSSSFPGAAIQVHFLADGAEKRYVQKIVDRIDTTSREGFVLIRCPQSVQQCIVAAGLPAVVYGQPYPGMSLASVKHDQPAVGRLMAEHALARGARRFAILMHAKWRYGDHQMIDAATETLAAAGVPLNDLKLRSLPPEREVVRHVVEEVLVEGDPPEAFLCRNDFYASIADEVLSSGEMSEYGSVYVVSGSHLPAESTGSFDRVVACMTLTEQVERIASLLVQRARGDSSDPLHVLIPVAFQKKE